MDGLPLLELRDYPRIDAAGVGDFYLLGDGRARFVLFDWFRKAGVWQRQIVGTVTRPVCTLRDEQRRFWEEAFQAPAPGDKVAMMH